MKIDFLKIKGAFPYQKGKKQGIDSYVCSIERLVKEMVGETLFESEASPPHFISYDSYFQELNKRLPIITHSPLEKETSFLSASLLCPEENTIGARRFFVDKITRQLVLGKVHSLHFTRSLCFQFLICPKQKYHIIEVGIEIENNRDLEIIKKRLPQLIEEMRLTLLATMHARKLVLSKPLTLHEKHMILLENLTTLVNRKEKDVDPSALEDMHHLLLKMKHEEKTEKIPDHLLPLIRQTPQAFDHHIFQGMQSLLSLFEPSFTVKRDIHHLYRTISYLYLFYKLINHQMQSEPHKHHVSLKILRSFDENKVPLISVLICVNRVKEGQRLNLQKLLYVIETYLSSSCLIRDSVIFHPRQEGQIQTLYCEFYHKKQKPFLNQEVKELKKRLSKEVLKQIKLSHAPYIQEHSEEELIRNILTLSKATHSRSEAPPVIINFLNETDQDASFALIFVSFSTCPIHLKEHPHIHAFSHQTKFAGILDHKHLQIAHIVKVKIKKSPFASQDEPFFPFSEMRKCLLAHLRDSFGPIRDFNSGMIVKQYETLSKLKALFPGSPLLEPFFYSLSPGSMQGVLSIETLRELHDLLEKICLLSKDSFPTLHFESVYVKEDALVVFGSSSDEAVDQIKEKIHPLIDGCQGLTFTDLSYKKVRLFGIIISGENPKMQKEMYEKLDHELASTL